MSSSMASAFVALVLLLGVEAMLFVIPRICKGPIRALLITLSALFLIDVIMHTVLLGGNWLSGLAVPCEDLPPSLSYWFIVFPLTHLIPDAVITVFIPDAMVMVDLFKLSPLDVSKFVTLADQATSELFEVLPTWAKCVSSV